MLILRVILLSILGSIGAIAAAAVFLWLYEYMFGVGNYGKNEFYQE